MNKNHLHSPFENIMYYFAVFLGLAYIAIHIVKAIQNA